MITLKMDLKYNLSWLGENSDNFTDLQINCPGQGATTCPGTSV